MYIQLAGDDEQVSHQLLPLQQVGNRGQDLRSYALLSQSLAVTAIEASQQLTVSCTSGGCSW